MKKLNYSQKIAAGHDLSLKIDDRGYLFATGRFQSKFINKWRRQLPEHRFSCVSAGPDFAYAVSTDGKLFTTGSNSSNQLGALNHPLNKWYLHDYLQEKVLKVFCGPQHGFILTKDSLLATGDNRNHQLGLEEDSYSTFTPVPIPPVFKLSTSDTHTIFILSNGKTLATGSNEKNQLFLGIHSSLSSPKEILPNTQLRDIAVGSGYSIAISNKYQAIVCGDNSQNLIGKDAKDSINPRVIAEKAYRAFAGVYNSAIVIDGYLNFSGSSASSQSILPNRAYHEFTPTDLSFISEVALGYSHSLFISKKEIKVIGSNLRGELGLGDNRNRNQIFS